MGFISSFGSGISGAMHGFANGASGVWNSGMNVVNTMASDGHEIFEGGLDIASRIPAGISAGLQALPGAIQDATDRTRQIVAPILDAPGNIIFGSGAEGTFNRVATLGGIGLGGYLAYKLLK